MKERKMCRWKRWFLTAAFCLLPFAGMQARAAEAGLISAFVQKSGYVLEQWNRVRPMEVYKNAPVFIQPDRNTPKLGNVKKGQNVNAWGQTDTGWYFIEYGDKLGFVRYENAAFIPEETALAAAQTADPALAALTEAQQAALLQAQQEALLQAQQQAALQMQQAAALQAQQEALLQAQQQAALQAQQQAALLQAQQQAALQAQQQAALQAQQQAALLQAQQQAALQAQQAAAQPIAAAPVVFIGDSRMVTLKESVEKNLGVCPVAVVAQSRSRYEWFHDSGIPQADRIIGKGSRVVINMGVNDLNHADKYASDVNAWGAVWTARGAVVYYASVNPVYANSHQLTEEAVERFNASLSAQLIPQIIWLDSNTWLKQHGVHATDGIHYKDDTNLNLYNYYMTMIGMI